MHLAYIWIVSHLSAKNYRNLWKFDEVLTKTNLLSFFWDTVYIGLSMSNEKAHSQVCSWLRRGETWQGENRAKR